MPEGDIALRVARRLDAALAGQQLVRGELRWGELGGIDLAGAVVLDNQALGKHLLTRLADGRTLHGALDPTEAATRFIDLVDAEWVDGQLSADYGLDKLASHLDRGDLALRTARAAFNRTFLGI